MIFSLPVEVLAIIKHLEKYSNSSNLTDCLVRNSQLVFKGFFHNLAFLVAYNNNPLSLYLALSIVGANVVIRIRSWFPEGH